MLAITHAGRYLLTVSKKELVLDTVTKLPADASFEDIQREIEILARITEGERAADEGRTTPHEQVKHLVDSWTTK